MLRRVAVVLLCVSTALAQVSQTESATPATKRSITETDLFGFQWIGDPQVSPDGSRVAFVKVIVNEKRDGYDTSIWTVRTSGKEPPLRMTNGKRDSQPRWSPDGKQIAFVRGGEKKVNEKPEPAQLAILSLAGGEASVITDLPKGANHPVWSPDGKRIAFISTTTPEDMGRYERNKLREKRNGDKDESQRTPGAEKEREREERQAEEDHESDIHVVTRAVYRFNGQGYLDPEDRRHIWVVDVPQTSEQTPEPRQLTTGTYDEREPFWSNDASTIYFASSRIDEPYYELPRTDLYSVPSNGGEVRRMTTVEMGISDIEPSPDGRRVAFYGSVERPVRSYSQPDLWVMDLAENAKPRNLTDKFDFDMGGSLTGDNRAPRGAGDLAIRWSSDGRAIFDVVGREGRSNIIRVDAQTGAISDITRGDHALMDFGTSADDKTVVALISTPVNIGDLFVIAGDGSQRQITQINAELFSRLNLTMPEEIWYPSFDGKRIHAWVQKPPDFDPKKKYPLILNIHGGPHAAYGWIFFHEFQWMAAKGYVVLYPNPRGSTSYGQEFGNIIQYRYPGDDYRDLMAGVDEVVKRGYIDTNRLGVTGGSGGGLLTNWTVTQTDRFRAAVSQRDISDWTSWWYTADFTLFHPTWFRQPPFTNAKEYVDRSPITYVQKIKTPMMFILGELDYRTPPGSGGEQLFRALKYLKRPTVLVMFPRENHDLSRSGEPWHRVERLQHIVGWFDKWLLGESKPEYDVTPVKQVPLKPETQHHRDRRLRNARISPASRGIKGRMVAVT